MSNPLANFSIAIIAMVSPLWLDWLTKISTGAALLLPVAGLLLAVLQIVRLLKDWEKEALERDEFRSCNRPFEARFARTSEWGTELI
jgi:hypothetical protein